MSSDHERPLPEGKDDQATPRESAPNKESSPAVRTPSHAERCRTLVASTRTASLSTIAREPAGYPYGSLVSVAADVEGRPLFLLSSLAEHTGNLAERAEASLLVTDPGPHKEPLAAGRATLLGPCRPVPEGEIETARAAFLKAHPSSEAITTYRDFAFYRLEPVAIRFIGGFGRMSWVDAEEYRRAEPDPLAGAAAGILSHMNKDHADALLAYATGLCGIEQASSALMTAVDRYGFEVSVTTGEGSRSERLVWDAPLSQASDVRKALIKLLDVARRGTIHSPKSS